MNCSLSDSSVHGIFQARVLECGLRLDLESQACTVVSSSMEAVDWWWGDVVSGVEKVLMLIYTSMSVTPRFRTWVLNLLWGVDSFSKCFWLCKNEHKIAKQTNYIEMHLSKYFFQNRAVIHVFINMLSIRAAVGLIITVILKWWV